MDAKQMTIDEFEDLIDQAYSLKLQAEELDTKKKDKEKELAELNRVICAEFERLDKTSYVGRRCQLVLVQKMNVTMPKDPDDKRAFFDYLKHKGIMEDMVSVNHNSLNAFFKAELAEAVATGDHGFKIPGLSEPKAYQYLSFKKR